MTAANLATIIALQAATIIGLCAWIMRLKREREMTSRYSDDYCDLCVRSFLADHDGEQV